MAFSSIKGLYPQNAFLVLPSKNEPFPMVILEALAIGTPVLVMPSCGFSKSIKNFESSYVATSESLSGLVESFREQYVQKFMVKTELEIVKFCANNFGISNVVESLEKIYLESTTNAK